MATQSNGPAAAQGGKTTIQGGPKASKATRWRVIVLIGVHLLAAIHIAHWMTTGSSVSPLEPSEAMEFAKNSVVNAGLVFFALTTLSTLILGRWFCGWACHVVALQDLSRALLIKVGIRPRPLRSKWMAMMPILAAGYMFVWPLIFRASVGDSFEVREVELAREGFWDTFPTLVPALVTFFVCGFVAVYFLGAKGFCTYACPYGAVFGLADKLSPGRIRVTDACVECGHCTATCTSNVDVSREVHDYGMVVDSGCMKCMDCVSVCPENALYFGMGKPALLASPRKEPRRPRKPLPLVEEIVAVLAFAFGYLAIRGYYQERGFLLSVGLAACFAFLVVTLVRLVRRADVKLPGVVLKEQGEARPMGMVVGLGTLALGACAVPFGIVPEISVWRANDAWTELDSARARWFEPGRAPLSTEEVASAEVLLDNARTIRERSGERTLDNTLRLAWGELFTGNPEGFESFLEEALLYRRAGAGLRTIYADQLRGRGENERALAAYRTIVESSPGHVPAVVRLAEMLGQAGDIDGARASIDAGLELAPDSAALLAQHAVFTLIGGDVDGAVADLQRAVASEPDFYEARDRLWKILAQSGRTDEALATVREGLGREGAPIGLFAAEGQLLFETGDTEGAESALRSVLQTEPGLQEARDVLWRMLAQSSRPTEAIEVLQEGVALGEFPIEWRAHLAQLFLVTDDLPAAATQARILVSQAPDRFDLLQVAGVVLRQAGASDEANAVDERMRQLDAAGR